MTKKIRNMEIHVFNFVHLIYMHYFIILSTHIYIYKLCITRLGLYFGINIFFNLCNKTGGVVHVHYIAN